MQAKIWNNSAWISEVNPTKIKDNFTEILKQCGFNILDILEHHFDPEGWTGLWLLSESHFAVHTFPEYGRTYIEISSCNLEFYQRFIELTENM